MDRTSESEKKRLQSLKEKKEAFRVKEKAVKNALKNLDNKSNKNKIIFDDNIDQVVEYQPKRKQGKKRKNLFDNDDNEDDETEVTWNNSDFDAKKSISTSNVTVGNDKRFKLDKRFAEDNEALDENDTGGNNEDVLDNEKDWQLNVLGNVLGVPFAPKIQDANKDSKAARKGMIRYDPTDDSHKEYEIIPEKPQPISKKDKKKKKLKEAAEDTVENPPVEVSKEIYFSVSETLTKSLAERGQFSLLGTYGKKEIEETGKKTKDSSEANVETVTNDKHKFNFGTRNPFKYDSSDSENENDGDQHEKSTKKDDAQDEQRTKNLFNKTDKFFFDVNDVRFNEAIDFFSKESTSDDSFNNLRRELKQIVRSKIRKNVKKNQPWGDKKKFKKLS